MANTGTSAKENAFQKQAAFSGRLKNVFGSSFETANDERGIDERFFAKIKRNSTPTNIRSGNGYVYATSEKIEEGGGKSVPVKVSGSWSLAAEKHTKSSIFPSSSDALIKLNITGNENHSSSSIVHISSDNTEVNEVAAKVKEHTSALTVIEEDPKSLLMEKLSPIVAHVFQKIPHDGTITHTHQSSVTIANQRYDLVITRVGGNIDETRSSRLDQNYGFAHKSKEVTLIRRANNSVKIFTAKEIFVVNESDPLRIELLEMLASGYGKPGVAIDPILEEKYNQGLSYPKRNWAATHYGYVNRNSKEKPIDYLHRVFGKYLRNQAWSMYRSELAKHDPSLESMLRDTIGGELRNYIPSKPPKDLLNRLKITS